MRTRCARVTIFFFSFLQLIWFLLSPLSAFNLEPRIPVIKTGNAGSYFGYSVAEHVILLSSELGEPKVIVGAPKAQGKQLGTNHSGAVYSCPLTTRQNDCEMLNIDDRAPVDDGELKDDQWLGVTVRSEGIGGYVMTCAHRYVKKSVKTRWGIGICYSLTQNLDEDLTFDPCANKDKTRAHESYGYCQVGTSGAISADRDIIMGAPGVFTWRGTIFSNSIAQDDFTRDKTWYMGPVTDDSIEKYSYLGMAVTSGMFFPNQMSFVAGAPRAGNTGQVVFFTKSKSSFAGSPLEIRVILEGEVFASSFGYELAAADLNGDKLPDLIVGAPFYYGKDAGGAIYVYMNSKDHGMQKRMRYVRLTGKEESRFGFAIANCSDLNKDGFEDIAVGAPYEGNGVLYIYLGSRKGIVETPIQIIKAEQLPIFLRSFGYSLSGGIDLDKNNYPDLVVGAYESDTVLVLRARPVINIVSEIKGDLSNIDVIHPECAEKTRVCFSFQTCFRISHIESVHERSIELNYTIEAENFLTKKMSRVYFYDEEDPEKKIPFVQKKLTVARYGHLQCRNETVYLNEKARDFLTPINFQMTYALVQREPEFPSPGGLLPNINRFPILNQQEAVKNFKAEFHKDCGGDDICDSDISVEAEFIPSKKEFILGEEKDLKLQLLIINRGEAAYDSWVNIEYSPVNIHYSHQDDASKTHYTCDSKENSTMISCKLGNPFRPDVKLLNLTLIFNQDEDSDPSEITETAFFFNITTNTTSRQTDKRPLHLRAKIVRKAEVSIKGWSYPDQLQYRGEAQGESYMKKEEDVGPSFKHSYKIINAGPSYVSMVRVNISFPVETVEGDDTGKWIFYLMEAPKIEHAKGTCYVDPKYLNFRNLTRKADIDEAEFKKNLAKVGKESERAQPERERHTGGSQETISGGGMSEKTHGGKHETSEETDLRGGHEEHITTTRINKTTITTHREVHTRTSYQNSSGTYFSGSSDTSYGKRKKRDTAPVAESLQLESQNVYTLDCETGTAKCIHIICEVRNLLADPNLSANIKIEGRLWSSTFIRDYRNVDHVSIHSKATMKIESLLYIKQNTEDDTFTIVTKAVPDFPASEKTKDIPIWVYILAACIGVFLLLLVILCLWKLGFFKRKTLVPAEKGNVEKQNDFNNY